MPSVNKVICVGIVGKKPETRYTSDSKPVASFPVALNEKWKGKDGKEHERTEWANIVCFGNLCKRVEYADKGDMVYLEGKMQTKKWTDKTGNDRYTTEVILDINGDFSILKKSKNNESSDESQQPINDGRAEEQEQFDDDVPF